MEAKQEVWLLNEGIYLIYIQGYAILVWPYCVWAFEGGNANVDNVNDDGNLDNDNVNNTNAARAANFLVIHLQVKLIMD